MSSFDLLQRILRPQALAPSMARRKLRMTLELASVAVFQSFGVEWLWCDQLKAQSALKSQASLPID